jgi:hypothetical protein
MSTLGATAFFETRNSRIANENQATLFEALR